MKKLIAIVVTLLIANSVFAADISCERVENKIVCTQPAMTIEMVAPCDVYGTAMRQQQTIADLKHEVKLLQEDNFNAAIINIQLSAKLEKAEARLKDTMAKLKEATANSEAVSTKYEEFKKRTKSFYYSTKEKAEALIK